MLLIKLGDGAFSVGICNVVQSFGHGVLVAEATFIDMIGVVVGGRLMALDSGELFVFKLLVVFDFGSVFVLQFCLCVQIGEFCCVQIAVSRSKASWFVHRFIIFCQCVSYSLLCPCNCNGRAIDVIISMKFISALWAWLAHMLEDILSPTWTRRWFVSLI